MLPGQYDFQIENAIKSAQKRKKISSDDYQNRKRKKLQPFKIGQRVVIKTNKGWTMQGTIDEILHEGRSYNVTTTGGAQLQRNRVMLRPVYEITSTSRLTARQKTVHVTRKKARATTKAAFMKMRAPRQLKLDQAQEFQSLENPALAVTKFIAES